MDSESEKKRASLEERKDKQQEEILKIEANIFQLANYYFVFQGVILTAILKDSSASLKCKYIGVPITISVIAAFLNLFALWIMADKYKDSLKLQGDIGARLHEHMQEALEAQVVAKAQAAQAQPQAEQVQAQPQALANAQAALALADTRAREAQALALGELAQPQADVLAGALTQAQAALAQTALAQTALAQATLAQTALARTAQAQAALAQPRALVDTQEMPAQALLDAQAPPQVRAVLALANAQARAPAAQALVDAQAG